MPAEKTFEWPIRVYYEDTDCAGVVYYANYLRFMERARTEWLRQLGWNQQKLLHEHGLVFVVVKATVDYKKPAVMDDLIVVKTQLSECGSVAFTFSQQVMRGEELLSKGVVRCGTLDAKTLRPTKMPESLATQLKNLVI